MEVELLLLLLLLDLHTVHLSILQTEARFDSLPLLCMPQQALHCHLAELGSALRPDMTWTGRSSTMHFQPSCDCTAHAAGFKVGPQMQGGTMILLERLPSHILLKTCSSKGEH